MGRAASTAPVDEPEGQAKPVPSGRLLLRMPRALHAELTGAAEREGVSLNQFITGTLAKAVGWGGGEDGAAVERPGALQTSRHARLVLIALFANVVVIGLVAIAAIAVLLLAWLG